MTLFTIGFTQKSAERFFTMLRAAGVRRIVDTRLNNRSQLAGFSKSEDLRYFLRELGAIEYRHDLDMAPTQEMLDGYRMAKRGWPAYEAAFNALLEARDLASRVDRDELDGACLLCSEHLPEHCHRRLVAEYLQRHFAGLRIRHLV
jgi:uncharacterized protein (DUF488 family)